MEEASKLIDPQILNSLIANLEAAGLTLEKDSSIMDDILTQYGDNGNIDLSNLSIGEVMKIDTSSIVDEDFRKALQDGIDDYESNITEAQKKILDSDWYKNLTPE
jgi:hypothetical protein